MNTYDLFEGKDLEIAERIQQRRIQLLIHSCIYYKLNNSIISDKKWDEWARELKTLQEHYPNIAEKVMWYDAFKDWDASTGAFLPLDDEWVMRKALQLCPIPKTPKPVQKKSEKKQKKKNKSKRLF